MSTPLMRAIQVHDYRDTDQLKLEDIPRPEPQAAKSWCGYLPQGSTRLTGKFVKG